MKRKGFAPIIILVLIGLGLLAYFGFFYKSPSNPLSQITNSIAPSTTPDATANWKTYSSKDFSLKYPDTLVASVSGETTFLYVEGLTPTNSETFVPNIFIGNKHPLPKNFTNLISWAKANSQLFPNLTKNSETKIGGYTFTKFESDSGPSASAIHYLANNDTTIFDFGVRIVGSQQEAGNQLQTFMPQVLSTFKFLGSPTCTSTPEGGVCTPAATPSSSP